MRLAASGSTALTPLEILQIFLTVICIFLAFLRPSTAATWFSFLEQGIRRFSERRFLCLLALALFPIALRLVLLPVYGPPQPFIHDEYAYLLQADTFAQGRLTNPPLPDWKQFQSIYVLVRPTYTSEYQVAQAAFIALGQVATGLPWAGVVASMGVFCGVLYWALLGWMPPTWALVGAALVDIEAGVLSYWMNSYWGGCVPAIGGALLLGALPRLRERHPAPYAFTLGAGAAILLHSRPVEGAILLAITAWCLFSWTFIDRVLSVRTTFYRIVPVLGLVLAAAVAFMGYYNARVTGKSAQLPYLLYRAEYGIPQGFYWQKPVIVNKNLPVDIQSEYKTQLEQQERRNSIKGLIIATAAKIRIFWTFYLGAPLTVPLVMLPFIWRDRNMRIVFWALITVVGFDNLTFHAFFPHYAAPVMVAIFVVILQCIRSMRARSAAGLFLSRSLPMVCAIGLLIPVLGRFAEAALPSGTSRISKLWNPEFNQWISREQFTPFLEKQPGKQLVLVRYDPSTHRNDNAWIFNLADLQHAKTVWAREGSTQENRSLMQHFADRRVWLGEPDKNPPSLVPYPFSGN